MHQFRIIGLSGCRQMGLRATLHLCLWTRWSSSLRYLHVSRDFLMICMILYALTKQVFCPVMFVCLDVIRASIRTTIHQFREAHVVSKAVTNALHTVPSSWRFWPFAVYATFRYLKKKHYTVALNLCSVAWTVYLSRGAGAESENN